MTSPQPTTYAGGGAFDYAAQARQACEGYAAGVSGAAPATGSRAHARAGLTVTEDVPPGVAMFGTSAALLFARLDPASAGLPDQVDGSALDRLAAQERAQPAGQVLAAAVGDATEASTAPDTLDLWTLMTFLLGEVVDSNIDLQRTGAKISAMSMETMARAKIDIADKLARSAIDIRHHGMNQAILQGVSGGLGMAIGGYGAKVGFDGAKLKSTAGTSGDLIRATEPAAQAAGGGAGQGVGQPVVDPVVPHVQAQAAVHVQPASALGDAKISASYNAGSLSQGAGNLLSAPSTYEEVQGRAVSTETQGETSERESDITVAEAVKASGEQSRARGEQSASEAISGLTRAQEGLAASQGKAAGAA